MVPRAFYSDWPIQIDVEGNYNGLGTFFEKVSQATRIINVNSIMVTGFDKEQDMNPSHTLKASCTATTFVFKEDQAQAQASDEKSGEKGGETVIGKSFLGSIALPIKNRRFFKVLVQLLLPLLFFSPSMAQKAKPAVQKMVPIYKGVESSTETSPL